MSEATATTSQGEVPPKDLAQIMRECEPDRQALIAELTPLFRELWTAALTEVETCLPDFKEPGSADFKLHMSIRNRVLNIGNAKLRELPLILKNYAVSQVFQRQVVLTQRVNSPVVLPPQSRR